MNRRSFLQLAGLTAASPLLMGRQAQSQKHKAPMDVAESKQKSTGLFDMKCRNYEADCFGDAWFHVVSNVKADVALVADGKKIALIETKPSNDPRYAIRIIDIMQYQHIHFEVSGLDSEDALGKDVKLRAWINKDLDF